MSPLISVPALEVLTTTPADVTVLDVRWRLGGPPGASEHAAGHVPGAVNVPTGADLREDGRFRDAGALAATYAAARVRPAAVYCGSGITACHTLLAMEVGGVVAALYPGSWSAWVTDPARPVATGEQGTAAS